MEVVRCIGCGTDLGHVPNAEALKHVRGCREHPLGRENADLEAALRLLVSTAEADIEQQITDMEREMGVERLWSQARGEFLDALLTARATLSQCARREP